MNAKRIESTILLLLMSLLFFSAGYWMLRYGGWSIEGDAMRLTIAAEAVAHEGKLVPSQFYSNGYAYPALLVFLGQITNLPIQVYQFVGSFWLVVIGLVAYLAYRELLSDVRLAALSVFLLLLQPDFIFYILRNSHERITWTCGLLILWLWVRHARVSQISTQLMGILAVYLILWAMIANNAYLASTIVTTYLIALLLSATFERVMPRLFPSTTGWLVERRLLYIPLTGLVLVFVFVTYAYSPARAYYLTLNSIVERLATLFLAADSSSSQPYNYVQSAWVSQEAYFLLTGTQWLIVLASGAAWLRDGARIISQGTNALSRTRWLLWFFYIGFAAQLAMGVIIDFTGFLASNLQVRLFTPFALILTPLTATWFDEIKTFAKGRSIAVQTRPWRVATITLGSLGVILALLKSTNDPLVGNQWIFYSPREQVAFEWVDHHLVNSQVWVDTNPHQIDVMQYRKGHDWQLANSYLFGAVGQEIKHVLLSELTLLQANRSKIVLPSVVDRNRVYDNGDAQLYHRPETPFQR